MLALVCVCYDYSSFSDYVNDNLPNNTSLGAVGTPTCEQQKNNSNMLNKAFDLSLDNIKVWNTQQETDQYVRLCAGEDLRPQKVQDKLYCKYEHRNKPYYM